EQDNSAVGRCSELGNFAGALRCLDAIARRPGWNVGIDPGGPPPYVPRLPRDPCHEDRQFAEDVEKARQELPHRAAQGARLRHQQDQSALQGAPGLRPRGGVLLRGASGAAAIPDPKSAVRWPRARPYAGHPRLKWVGNKDVDGRDKPGHSRVDENKGNRHSSAFLPRWDNTRGNKWAEWFRCRMCIVTNSATDPFICGGSPKT